MPQIVIDIPNGPNRRYTVEKADDARKLLLVLDEVLRDPSKLNRQQKQDLHDGLRADRILAEMRRTASASAPLSSRITRSLG